MGTLAGSWHLRLAAKYRGGSPGSIPTLSHQPSGDGCGAVGLVWAGGCGWAGPGGGGGGGAQFGRTGVGRGLQVRVWAGLVAAGPWVPVWVAHGPSAARCPMVPTGTPSATQPLSAAPRHSPACTDAGSLQHTPTCTHKHTHTHTCTPMHTACPPQCTWGPSPPRMLVPRWLWCRPGHAVVQPVRPLSAGRLLMCLSPVPQPGSALSPPSLQICPRHRACAARNHCCHLPCACKPAVGSSGAGEPVTGALCPWQPHPITRCPTPACNPWG